MAPGPIPLKGGKSGTVITQDKVPPDVDPDPPKPVLPENRPYDTIKDEVGQFGEHAASKGDKWGLWLKGQWLIEPDYDEIDVFRNDKARVRLNAQRFDINQGNMQIREQ